MSMKKSIYLSVLFSVATGISANAQTKIKDGTVTGSSSLPNPKAILDLESTDKGVLFPRMTKIQRDAMTSVPEGLVVYNTTESCLNQYTGAGWASLCDNSEFCGIVMVGDDNDETFTYTNPNVTTNRIFEPNDPGNSCALYITENGSTWIWNGTSYITKSDANVNPWFNKANSQPSKSLTDRIYHLGSVQIGTGNITGTNSLSVGNVDTVTGDLAAAIGYKNKNRSSYSISVGYNNTSSTGNSNNIFGLHNEVVAGSTNFISGYRNKIQSGSYHNVFGYSGLVDGGTLNSLFASQIDTIETTGSRNVIIASYNNDIKGFGNTNLMTGISNLLNTGSVNFISGSNNEVVSSSSNGVFGNNNTLNNTSYSGVFGHTNADSSWYTFMAGSSNKIGTSANFSSALGFQNYSTAQYSLLSGNNLRNEGMQSATVVGRFNDPISGALFSVGAGNSEATRRNAFTVKSSSLIMPKLNSYPGSPVEGEMFFHTGTKKTYVYDGTTWQALY